MNNKKKILVVDEELSYRELLKEALRTNYNVIETESFSDSVLIAKSTLPDLIIIDVEMSGKRGVELCEILKEEPETCDIPVLLATSLANKEDIILGLKAGANDYIEKPMCLSAVVSRIESHLRTQEDYTELEHKDMLMLLELSETISVTKSPNAILRLIVKKMSKIMDVTRCSVISLVDGKKIVVRASSDLEKNKEINLDLNKYPEIRKSIETRKTVIINDIKNDPLMESVRTFIENLEYNSVIVIPLIKKETVIGTFFLRIVSRESCWVSERISKLCQMVANIAAIALENAMLFDSIKTAHEYFKDISVRDDLTNLFNRRHFYCRLKEEFSRAVRHNEPLSLVFFDVDNFKSINDTYGHAQGDKVLTHIGQILNETVRESDLPARYGGDEFAIILPNTNVVGALEMASRIVKEVKSQKIEGFDSETISISAGVSACINNSIPSFHELLRLADQAMYQSKSQGTGLISGQFS